MPYQIVRTHFHSIFLLLALLLTGCAGTPEKTSVFIPPVYPPPPDQARFIFERTLLYSEDVEEYTTGMRIKQFASGTTRKLRGLVKPYDVAVYNGRVYVSDSVQRSIAVFDIPGKKFLEIGIEKPGELAKPLGIDISSTGHLFVSDISAKKILEYDENGVFIRNLSAPDKLHRPSDVAISPDNLRLYVVDTGGVDSDRHVIHIFDLNSGEYLKAIGVRGTKDGEFNLPLQADVDPEGTLYVVDSGNFRIEAFDQHNNHILTFGSVGRSPGQFARPKGISTDKEGNIYVVDTAFGNVQIFNPQGQLLMFLGERGQSGMPGKYMLPSGIDVDKDGRVYIVDQFFRKVDIYRPVGLDPEADRKVLAGQPVK